MDDCYTEDFADIVSCARERCLLIDIMRAWGETGLPKDFGDTEVRPAFNRNSGYVFLVNDEYEVCMLRDGKLESFYTSPSAGEEGFFDELAEMYPEMDAEDQDWLREVAAVNGRTLPPLEDDE
jgi:hypothetical protein